MLRHRSSSCAIAGLIGACLIVLGLTGGEAAGRQPAAVAASIPASAGGASDPLAPRPVLVPAAVPGPLAAQAPGGLRGMIARSRFGRTGLGGLYVRGGLFMPWLLVAALVGLACTLDHWWMLARTKTDARRLIGAVIVTLRSEGVDAASQLCQRTRGPTAAILNAGLQKVAHGPDAVERACAAAGGLELAFLERGLRCLTSVINIAPLLGFLGTVSGIIHAFTAIGSVGLVDAPLVAGGIEEALIATATALVVTIPCSVGYNHFTGANARFVSEMEESARELIAEVARLQPPAR